MKKMFFLTVLILIGAYVLGCKPHEHDTASTGGVAAAAAMTKADSIKHGEYLSNIMGCNDCHSPKIMTDKGPAINMDLLLSGHPANEPLPKISDKGMTAPGQWALLTQGQTAAVGPWGISYTANLTPDETGLGNWSFANFEKAIRQGKFKGLDGGRMLMPPMPWQTYASINDKDLQSLWLYLRSIKPVKNVVPAYTPPPIQ